MRFFDHIPGILLYLALSIGGASAQDIGKVATLTPQMQGQPPGGALSTLRQGAPVVADHRIVTGQNGRGQLLFVDETTLSVASQSEIVLDRFVYDPNRRGGEIGLSLTRGALRFIGGRASDRQPAEIRTPTGTVSVRGSTALVLVQNGRTIAVFVAGKRMCFRVVGGAQHCTNRFGGVLDESGYRGKIEPASLAAILTRIDGRPTRASAATGGTGSGIVASNPPARGPVSSRGESYDDGGGDSTFPNRVREGLLPDGILGGDDPMQPDLPPMEMGEEPTIGTGSLCDDPTYVEDSFDGDLTACLTEFGLI